MQDLIHRMIEAAIDYRQRTGRALGITGELGEVLAANILDLDLAPVRQAGYDALDAKGRTIQIKTRSLVDGKKKGRIGSINLSKEFDYVYLVLLNDRFQVTEIHSASRSVVTNLLSRPGSRARNVRGQPAITQFIAVAQRIWPLD